VKWKASVEASLRLPRAPRNYPVSTTRRWKAEHHGAMIVKMVKEKMGRMDTDISQMG
jgi:hypothetical protein